MRKSKLLFFIISTILLLTLLSGCGQPGQIEQLGDVNPETVPAVVEPAPELVFSSAFGTELSLADFAGQPVLVNFWATWCGPCVAELPSLNNLYAEYGDQVAFIMLNMTDGKEETQAKVVEFISDNGYSFPVYYDHGLAASKQANVLGYPTTWLINSQGQLVESILGMKSEEQWKEYIDSLLNQE